MDTNVRRIFKSVLASSGMTLKSVIEEYNKTHEPTTPQNISNKLSRGTIQYQEVIDLYSVMGYDLVTVKRDE